MVSSNRGVADAADKMGPISWIRFLITQILVPFAWVATLHSHSLHHSVACLIKGGDSNLQGKRKYKIHHQVKKIITNKDRKRDNPKIRGNKANQIFRKRIHLKCLFRWQNRKSKMLAGVSQK